MRKTLSKIALAGLLFFSGCWYDLRTRAQIERDESYGIMMVGEEQRKRYYCPAGLRD